MKVGHSTINTKELLTYSFMWEPLVCNDDLGMCLKAGLDPSCFPIPEDNVTFTIATAYPLPIR